MDYIGYGFIFLTHILTFFFAFCIGLYKANPEELPLLQKTLKKTFSKSTGGTVRLPTEEEKNIAPIQRQTDEAMSETLRELFPNKR